MSDMEQWLSFFSALSQEEQDDAQLKIEDILQMVSYDHNIP